MDDPLEHEYRQRLISGIAVLTKLLQSLDSGSTQGEDVARKLAASLRRSADSSGYPQLTAAAVPFETAPRTALAMLTRRLIRVMENVVNSGWDAKHRILVVDPDRELAEELASKLAAPTREVLLAESVAEAWRTIGAKEIALVVLDLVLPDADGRNFISRLRSDPRTGSIPIVVLSDWGGHEVRAECFALGADQFFQKSGDMDLLAVSVASTLHRSIAQARDTHTDVVTRLLSREGLREKYRKVVERARKKEEAVSLAVLDVEVGDITGPPEELLGGFVHEIRRVLRPTDAVARWGEVELVLVLGDTDRMGAARALERIRESVIENPIQVGGQTVCPGFTSGAVEIKGEISLDEAVAEATRELIAERLVRGSGQTTRPSNDRPRILIVDTDSENAFIARRRFEEDGFEILHIETAREALNAASVGRIRLIMLDTKLPDMSGLELVDRLRQMPRLSQTPLIMTSALGRDLDAVRAFDRGVDDYVFKPCTSNALVARMRRLLKRTGPPSSGPFKVIRKLGAMAGLFAGDQLFELVQMVGLNRKTGRLVVASDDTSGHIDFLEGMVTKAWSSRGEEGPLACQRLFGIDAGRFEFWPGSEAVSTSGELLRLSVDNLLLDALRRRDESGLGIE